MEFTRPPLLPTGHSLSNPRLSPTVGRSPKPKGYNKPVDSLTFTPPLDTSTLAAHDFDVDVRSGFMPPEPPVDRLPTEWQIWELVLDKAREARLKVGDGPGITAEDVERSREWREIVLNMPLLGHGRLTHSERLLRRAHLVLAWILHYYVHTHLPSSIKAPIIIPSVLAVPLLAVSRELDLPPVLTYSDTVLYNWKYKENNHMELNSLVLFSGTKDEEHFFLTSAYIELAGVEALSLMQQCFDEAFVADSKALRRITSYLKRLASVIKRLTHILDAVKEACDPKVFYNDVRPWFRGEDSGNVRWIFLDENGEEVDFGPRRELSGPSAGQSSLIHALDIFLGVDHSRRPNGATPPPPPASASASPATSTPSSSKPPPGFLERMQAYMPRHHRAFMNHLKVAPRPIRQLVVANSVNSHDGSPTSLSNAYDAAVLALKGLRDTHIRIATLYIVSQMPRRDTSAMTTTPTMPATGEQPAVAKGTGGSDLVPFLKGSRDDTTNTMLNRPNKLESKT